MSDSEKERIELIERLAADNPAVDAAQVIEVTRLIEELRDQGLPRPEYNIESPYKSFRRRNKCAHCGKEWTKVID